MFKITTDTIAEAANGTDCVLMSAPDLMPFPEQGGRKASRSADHDLQTALLICVQKSMLAGAP
jgi:hypothetical protein